MERGLTQSPVRIGGQTLIDQVLLNAKAGEFELGFTVLVPCVFNLYLNPEDYARLSGIFPHIREEARRALQDWITRTNAEQARSASARGFSLRPRKVQPKEYKIAGSDFVFEFFSDDDGTVPVGDVEIHSELAETPRPGFHGVRTTLIGREPSVPMSRTGAVAQPVPAATERVYAEIRYEDDSGPQLFPVVQDQVSIGRGGDGRVVDLALYTDDEISREHVRIRRDAARNRFFIVDRSMNGTFVDGRRLVRDVEEKLPPKATILLADRVQMVFEQR